MKRPTLKYIGRFITHKTIIDVIHNEKLNDGDIIILNSKNFDDIVIEYRDFYNESIDFPHYLLGVEIREAQNEIIPIDRIGIFLKNSSLI